MCSTPCTQIDKTLAAEQKRADFQPRGDGALALDMPTDACVLVTALLRAVVEVAADTLHPANLGPVMAEVSDAICCDVLQYAPLREESTESEAGPAHGSSLAVMCKCAGCA